VRLLVDICDFLIGILYYSIGIFGGSSLACSGSWLVFPHVRQCMYALAWGVWSASFRSRFASREATLIPVDLRE
jgi:hypothetical protein